MLFTACPVFSTLVLASTLLHYVFLMSPSWPPIPLEVRVAHVLRAKALAWESIFCHSLQA